MKTPAAADGAGRTAACGQIDTCMEPPPVIPDHELLRPIGRGACGEVWLARNVMGVMRAVKIVRRSSFADQRPFEREFAAVKRYEPVSRAAAGLVNVLHAGRTPDGAAFHYVMELADSAEPGLDPAEDPDRYAPCTLRTLLGRMGRMPPAECLEIAVSLTNGIADLHRVGLVHRDVKPSNIIFVGGRAKLADIGLVGDMTESRSYVGTEGYVPPEGPGRPGADLYGLGRVLYEMATGYEATRFPALPAEWTHEPEREGVFEFYEVVLRCCEPDESRRYRTADELLADLALLQSGQSVRQVRQLRGRIAVLRKLAAAAAAAGVIAGTLAWWQGRLVARAEQAEAEARRLLFSSLVQQARSARRSGDPDARFTALDLLEQAAALHGGAAEVREEFISALATPGLRVTRTLDRAPGAAVCDRTLTWQAAALPDGRIAVRRTADGSLVREIDGGGPLTPLALGTGGGTLLAADRAGRLRTWQGAEESAAATAAGTGEVCWAASADAARALAWRADGTVTVLTKQAGETVERTWRVPEGYRADVDAAPALAPDGSLAVFGRSEGQGLRVHSLPDGALLAELKAPRPLSAAVAVSADGRVVAAGFLDGGIGIWRLDGTCACETIDAGMSCIGSLAVTPDGRFLLSGSWAGLVHLWDLADGSRLARVGLPFAQAAFSEDGRRLVLDSARRATFCEFEPADVCRAVVLPRPALRSQDGVYGYFSLHPHTPWLVASASGPTLLIDGARAAMHRAWPPVLRGALFQDDGRALLLPGRVLFRVPVAPAGDGWQAGLPVILATAGAGGEMRYPAAVAGVAAVRDGETWRIFKDGRPPLSLTPDPAGSDSAAISPDGQWLATAGRDGRVLLHRTDDGTLTTTLPAAPSWPGVAFQPCTGHLLVSDAGGLRLLTAGSWAERWRTAEDANGATGAAAAFSLCGRWLAAAGAPGHVVLRHAADGRRCVTFRRERESVSPRIQFSGDGSMLWEADRTSLVLWRWDLHALRTFLRARGLDWTDDPLPPPIPDKAPQASGLLLPGAGKAAE